MVGPSQFPNPLPEDEAQTNETANAEELSMLLLQPDMEDVPMVKSDASSVDTRLTDSDQAGLAEVAMPSLECQVCKHLRDRLDQPPQKLRVLPSEVTDHHLFKKDAPLTLCPECDGGAAMSALKLHQERTTA